MFEWIFSPEAWIALATLTALEIVLGVDNIIFISILVGVTLMVEGFDVHVPKGYIYFAMAFSVSVEMLNLRMRRNLERNPVQLHKKLTAD